MRRLHSPDGTPIAAYDLGGSGPDVLLVHATGFCGAVWEPVAAELGDRRCVTLDVRAHGRSGRPADDDLRWERGAEDVLATVDGVGLDRPFGVGHSMGGALLLLAEIARPGTFRGLWLFEPIVIPTDHVFVSASAENPLAESARRRRPEFDSIEAARANFSTKAPLDVFTPEALDAYLRGGFEVLADGRARLRCAPEDEARNYENGSRHDAGRHLAEVRCPVTVVAGASNGLPGPADFAPQVVAGLPDGRLVERPELGHFGPMQAPGTVAELIRASS